MSDTNLTNFTNEQLTKFFKSLKHEQQLNLFEQLSPEQQEYYFKQLSPEYQLNILSSIDLNEQKNQLEKFDKLHEIEMKEIFGDIKSLRKSTKLDKYIFTLGSYDIALIISGQSSNDYDYDYEDIVWYKNYYPTKWIEENMDRVKRIFSKNIRNIYYHLQKLYFIEDLPTDVIRTCKFAPVKVVGWPYQFNLYAHDK